MSLAHRIGRRGAALLFFAFLDLVYGLSLVDPSSETRAAPLFTYLARLMPLQVYGLFWLLVGVVLLVSAFMVQDRVGFMVASFLKVLWGILNLAAWGSGVPRAYAGAAIWIALAGFVQVLSGWPEPPRGENP